MQQVAHRPGSLAKCRGGEQILRKVIVVINNIAQSNSVQPRKRAPLYFRPIADREQQWRHRSERIADCNFPLDRLEEVNDRDPFGWALTTCPLCLQLVASVILDDGREHFCDLGLNAEGRLCAAVGVSHGCNRLFAGYWAAETDQGAQR
jgi:hypothetical protein